MVLIGSQKLCASLAFSSQKRLSNRQVQKGSRKGEHLVGKANKKGIKGSLQRGVKQQAIDSCINNGRGMLLKGMKNTSFCKGETSGVKICDGSDIQQIRKEIDKGKSIAINPVELSLGLSVTDPVIQHCNKIILARNPPNSVSLNG